jgi:hypothetical protein
MSENYENGQFEPAEQGTVRRAMPTAQLERAGAGVPGGRPGADLGPVGDLPPEKLSLAKRVVAAICIAALALVSFFPLASVASSPTTYQATIDSLDAKAQTVSVLIGTTAAVSTAITVIPGDTATPLAEKFMDLSADFAIVLGAIYLEKYMLTIFGLAAFRVIIPVACLLGIGCLFALENLELQARLRSIILKLVLFAAAMLIVVPASVSVSNLIEETYHYDAAAVAAEFQDGVETSSATTESDSATATTESGSASTSSTDSDNPVENFLNWAGSVGDTVSSAVSDAADAVTSGVTGVLDKAKQMVSDVIEAFAVMIVTNCVVPIVVMLIFIWLINVLLGVNIQVPARPGAAFMQKRRASRAGSVQKQ